MTDKKRLQTILVALEADREAVHDDLIKAVICMDADRGARLKSEQDLLDRRIGRTRARLAS